MRARLLRVLTIIGLLALSLEANSAVVVNGAGSTFAAPAYSQWVEAYEKIESTFKLNYQAIGSSRGISRLKEKSVVFCSTDKPLRISNPDNSKDSLNKIGLVQFPSLIGGIIIGVNIEGIASGQMSLSKEALIGIYLGEIKKWNDPRIVKHNQGLNLPDKEIVVIYRTDSSGTTFVFTDYLSKISDLWKYEFGSGDAIRWPTGLGAKGNQGMVSKVKEVPNSIGYMEYGSAKRQQITYVKLETDSGHFIEPGRQNFQNAIQNSRWEENLGFATMLTESPGKDSWPIIGVTYILMYQRTTAGRDMEAEQLLKFLTWAYGEEGDKIVDDLGFISLPKELTSKIFAYWHKIRDSRNNPLKF